MSPSAFLAQEPISRLRRDANVLSHFGGAELALFARAKRSQTVHRCPDIASLSAGIGIPEMLKAPLAKSAIRSKIRQVHLEL